MRFIPFILLASLTVAACQTVQPSNGFSATQIAVLKENGFERTSGNWEFGMADRLLFESDGSTLIPAQVEVIRAIAATLVKAGVHGAQVEGHTDSTGTAAYNQALSLQRAQAVARAMAKGGMAEAAIRTVGMGASNPIDNNATTLGRQENRRVVIIVTGVDASAP